MEMTPKELWRLHLSIKELLQMTTPSEEYIALPPIDLISQITTFKFFQDSIKNVYQTNNDFRFQIIISKLSTSQVIYAWKQRKSPNGTSGEIEQVLKSTAVKLQGITDSFIKSSKLLGDDLNLIRVNYNGNKNELFALPDLENDLGITLIIEK